MRKNKTSGPVKGAGRKKGDGYVKKLFCISNEALDILNRLPKGQASKYVNDAIILSNSLEKSISECKSTK